jgi:hypothetical protein
LSHPASPFCMNYFWGLVLCPASLDCDSPIYPSRIVGIKGMNYHAHLIGWHGILWTVMVPISTWEAETGMSHCAGNLGFLYICVFRFWRKILKHWKVKWSVHGHR